MELINAIFHEQEGDCVNIDVTAPGATLALGMIYFQTNNRAIAEWMVAPNTPYLLDQVRHFKKFYIFVCLIYICNPNILRSFEKICGSPQILILS